MHHITEDLFLISAQTVADHVKNEDLERGSLYPPLNSIRECSIDIAAKIAEYAYAKGWCYNSGIACEILINIIYRYIYRWFGERVSGTKRQAAICHKQDVRCQL